MMGEIPGGLLVRRPPDPPRTFRGPAGPARGVGRFANHIAEPRGTQTLTGCAPSCGTLPHPDKAPAFAIACEARHREMKVFEGALGGDTLCRFSALACLAMRPSQGNAPRRSDSETNPHPRNGRHASAQNVPPEKIFQSILIRNSVLSVSTKSSQKTIAVIPSLL